MKRALYTVVQWYQQRKKLRRIVADPQYQLAQVELLTHENLAEHGIQALVLDVDGVLTPHGQTRLDESVASWLVQLSDQWSGQIFILTNNPYGERLRYFQSTFPELQVILVKRKKPYPDGLLQVCDQMQCEPSRVLMIDDRLATGCLAACIAGTDIRWITQPKFDLQQHYWAERFFQILRWMDLILIKK